MRPELVLTNELAYKSEIFLNDPLCASLDLQRLLQSYYSGCHFFSGWLLDELLAEGWI